MQLKLSVGDEMLTIDVKSSDTFQDISERLCSLGNIKVDMNKLRVSNNDKPFDMSTNVINYFTKSSKETSTNCREKPETPSEEQPQWTCRLCGESIPSSPHFLFDHSPGNESTLAEKANVALPIYVSKNDSRPKQVCGNCVEYLNRSYGFVQSVLVAQKVLEDKVNSGDSTRHAQKEDRCPMCNNGHLKTVIRKPVQETSSTKSDVEKSVMVNVPIQSTVHGTAQAKRGLSDTGNSDFYYADEIVFGYWDQRNSTSSTSANTLNDSYSSLKKYRKRLKSEDDHDWTIDEEYIPVSRRGRPKGRKNKPKVTSVVQETCILCEWTGNELDMLAHTVNVHCQPDMNYFPCPMCKMPCANEIELENHIERHRVTEQVI